jgi:hypothetical protein
MSSEEISGQLKSHGSKGFPIAKSELPSTAEQSGYWIMPAVTSGNSFQ